MKICVYAIALNESAFVERFCEAVKDADLVVIGDTGSSDDTVKLAEQCGAIVHKISIKPWRFDDARNAVLALLPADIDVCFSLDLDEVMQPGWREEVERVWEQGVTTRLSYLFDWSGAGNPFRYDKVHSRHGHRWIRPCHEVVVPYGIDEVWASTDKLLVVHQPDPTKSRAQYLPLLKMSIDEYPDDPRNAFYYARELSFHSRWEESIAECKRYLALGGANWSNERCYAYRVMARCHDELGQFDEALLAARLGVIEAPGTREPWVEVAKLTYRRQLWEECFGAAMAALRITNREAVYTVDPEVWGAVPHDLAAIAAWNMGLKDVAVEQGEKALALEPGNERFIDNLRWYRGDRTAP